MRIVILFVTLTFGTTNASATDYGKWTQYVPAAGRAPADVMILGAPRKTREIGLRLQAAARQKPEWFRAYAANAAPGKPLPYHKNLRIAEDEYKQFISGLNHLVLLKSGEVELAFEVDKTGTLILKGLPGEPPRNELAYSPSADIVRTPYGALTAVKPIDQNNKEAPTGRWAGVQWKLERGTSDQNFAVVQFAIGRLKDQPKRIIYYDVKVANQGHGNQYHYVLLY